MNKLGILGVGLAAVASMGGGMLLTGSASASSTADLGAVSDDADPTDDPTTECVHTDSAAADIPEGAVIIGDIGEPITGFDLPPGSTWHSVSIDVDGNITTDQGTDGDLPTEIGASWSHTSGAYAAPSDGSVMISIPEDDIRLGTTCNP